MLFFKKIDFLLEWLIKAKPTTKNMSNECPICYDEIAKDKGVRCCNGHEVCEKHFIQRAKAIYNEGRKAFGDDDVHRCFICRCDMDDELFSPSYHKLLVLTQAFGLCKLRGHSQKYAHVVYDKFIFISKADDSILTDNQKLMKKMMNENSQYVDRKLGSD